SRVARPSSGGGSASRGVRPAGRDCGASKQTLDHSTRIWLKAQTSWGATYLVSCRTTGTPPSSMAIRQREFLPAAPQGPWQSLDGREASLFFHGTTNGGYP